MVDMTESTPVETPTVHRVSWFAVVDGEEYARQASMRGRWGYDVVCSCGWRTHTGDADRSQIEREIYLHKWLAENADL
jgi:hypothetical protein